MPDRRATRAKTPRDSTTPQEALRALALDGLIPAAELTDAPAAPVYARLGATRYIVREVEVETSRSRIEVTSFNDLTQQYVAGPIRRDVRLVLETEDVRALVAAHVDGVLHLDHQVGAHHLVGDVEIYASSVMVGGPGHCDLVTVRGRLLGDQPLRKVLTPPEDAEPAQPSGHVRGMRL